MAEIHRRGSIIKKRMTTWKRKGVSEPKPKKKSVHVERIKAGLDMVWGGIKKVGSELQKPETKRKIARAREIGGNIGSMSSDFFALPGYDEPKKKRTKSKKRR